MSRAKTWYVARNKRTHYTDLCVNASRDIIAMPFIYTVLGDCKSHPCTNGGTCTINANGYKCACTDNYLARNCQGEF